MIKKILTTGTTVFLFFLLSVFLPPSIYAQSCGIGTSCGNTQVIIDPPGCPPGDICFAGRCLSDDTISCTTSTTCSNATPQPPEACVVSGNACFQVIPSCSYAGGCVLASTCHGGGTTCPSGQIYCGGCIQSCRANTQTCTEWIADECSGGGPGGGGGATCTGNENCGSSCTSNAQCGGATTCDPPLGGQPTNVCWSSTCCNSTPTGASCGGICQYDLNNTDCAGGLTCTDFGISGTLGRCWANSCEDPPGPESTEKIGGTIYTPTLDAGTTRAIAGQGFSIRINGQHKPPDQYFVSQYNNGSGVWTYEITFINTALPTGTEVLFTLTPQSTWFNNAWRATTSSGGLWYNDMTNVNTAKITIHNDGNPASVNNTIDFAQSQTQAPIKSCAVIGLLSNYSYTAPAAGANISATTPNIVMNAYSSRATSELARLWLVSNTGGTIAGQSGGQLLGGRYYYPLGTCNTDPAGLGMCTVGSLALANVPAGSYKLFCDLTTAPNGCSGNPFNSDWNSWYRCANPPVNDQNLDDGSDRVSFNVSQCTPTCTNACGQDNGCLGTCPDSGGDAPGNISSLSINGTAAPLNATSTDIETSSDAISYSWGAVTNATAYYVVTYSQASVNDFDEDSELNTRIATCTPNPAIGSSFCAYTAALSSNYDAEYLKRNDLIVAIKAVNTTCNGLPAGSSEGGWIRKSYNLVTSVSGNIYNYATSCSDTSAGTTTPDLGSTVGFNSTTVNATNPFTIPNVPYFPSTWGISPGIHSFSLNLVNSTPENSLICAPGCGCTLADQYAPPISGSLRFFVQNFNLSNGAWWQVRGGHVYSGGAITSRIPDTCETDTSGVCQPHLATDQGSIQAGVVIAGTAANVNNWDTSQLFDGSGNITVTNTAVNQDQFSYDFFRQKITTSVNLDADTVTTVTQLTTGLSGGMDTVDNTKYITRDGDLTFNLNAPLAIGNNRIVLLVDGNVTINRTGGGDATITTGPTGFFMIIARNNITFASSVGTADQDSITPNVSGVFLATEILEIEASDDSSVQDLTFVGEGTFVGLIDVELNRNYAYDEPTSNADNNTRPVERFIYRPSFLTDFPQALSTPKFQWQEIN